MDLLRPVLTAVGTWIAADLLAAVVMAVWATPAQLESGFAKIAWVAVPQFLVGLLAATAAAYAHRRPYRDATGRHALAVLGPVAVLAAVQALLNLGTSTFMWALAIATAAELVGGGAGWLLVSRVLRHRERQENPAAAYF